MYINLYFCSDTRQRPQNYDKTERKDSFEDILYLILLDQNDRKDIGIVIFSYFLMETCLPMFFYPKYSDFLNHYHACPEI